MRLLPSIFTFLAIAGFSNGSNGVPNGENEERFWVEDGCVFHNHEHDGSWQPKFFEAGVRCCSNTNDGNSCDTPFHCDNKMTFGDAIATCADNDQRLCTKEEMLDRICCGTGGDCDGYLVWTSTPHPNNTANDVKKCCEESGVPKACIGLCMEEGSLSSRNLPIGEFGACAKFTNYISKCKVADYDSDNYDDPDYVLPTESEGCKVNQFECDSGACIDKDKRCDGKNDCNVNKGVQDFSDEEFCDSMTKKGHKCIFPFIYKGKEHHRCTTTGNFQPWCGYSVNEKNEMYKGYWDYCKYN